MPPETELLRFLCRTPLSDTARARVRALLRSGPDWDSVFKLAERWEVEPVIFSNLRSFNDDAIPPEVLEAARQVERKARAMALAGTLRAADLVKRFEAIGIPVLLLKGPALGIAAYGDPSLRTFADADLLVRRQDIPRAAEILLALDYQREYDPADEEALIRNQHALEFSLSGRKVELHWALLSRHLRLNIDLGELWSSARAIQCVGSEISVIAQHHLFLFICAHGAKHEWERLRWICDVAQLVDRLGDDEVKAVVSLAERLHAKGILLLGLVLARDVLRADVARFDTLSLGDERKMKPLVRAARERLGIPQANVSHGAGYAARIDSRLGTLVYWIKTRERLADRVACLAIVLFSPTGNDGRSGALRWLTRPLRLAARALRQAAA